MKTIDLTTGVAAKDKDLQRKVRLRIKVVGGYDTLVFAGIDECADFEVLTNGYFYGSEDDWAYDLCREVEKIVFQESDCASA